MSKLRKFTGFIETDENGKAQAVYKKGLTKFFEQWPNERFEMEVKKVNDHSRPLQKYYFGVVIPQMQLALNDAGYAVALGDVHDFIKQFCPVMREQIIIDKKVFEHDRSLTDLDTQEFRDYIEQLAKWALDFLDAIIEID